MIETSRDFRAFCPFSLPVSSLKCSLFIHTDHVNYRIDVFTLITSFSNILYPDLQSVLDARQNILAEPGNIDAVDLPEDLQLLDATSVFWCDVTQFVKIDPMNDASPFWVWTGVGRDGESLPITMGPAICPPGVNTRLVEHPATLTPLRPAYFIMILCPQILTQTPDRPKMWATLRGQELTNTRPDAGIQDAVLWLGMHIDALRQRVLSVWIGRMMILITSIIYSDRMHGIWPSF